MDENNEIKVNNQFLLEIISDLELEYGNLKQLKASVEAYSSSILIGNSSSAIYKGKAAELWQEYINKFTQYLDEIIEDISLLKDYVTLCQSLSMEEQRQFDASVESMMKFDFQIQ